MTRIVEKRRKRRAAKRRMKKRIVTVILMLSVMMLLPQMVNLAFASKPEGPAVTAIVSSGDSVWSIAKEYAPEGSDVRRLVRRIIAENDIVNGNIYSGQELIIPLD